jgi:biopolymer transport protein TolQ
MFEIISGASPVVLAVLILLVVASIASWAVIVFKFRELGAADRQTRLFIEAYQGGTLEAVYAEVRNFAASPLATVFRAGFRDLAQLEKQQASRRVTPDQADVVIKRLGWVRTEEALRLERGLSFLATIGSSTPFVGLFGTVVGIMNSFAEIGAKKSADLATVAPGISEAIVATAVGLAAAIPAVVAYNAFGNMIKKQGTNMDGFAQDFLNIVQRGSYIAHAPKG